ncbi:MAG: isoprenylcysteine carboxylmethyltransferase family protein [Terracidiphilus sp.]
MEITLFWKILVYGWVASETLLVFATRTRRSRGKVNDRGSLIILLAAIALSIFAGEKVRASLGPNLPFSAQAMTTAAIAVMVVGMALRWTAILSLGKRFSSNVAIRSNQTFHQGGIYRLVRHPAYTGSLAMFLAIGIQEGNWIACLAVMAPVTCAILYRIHVEEAALNEAFDAQYASYTKRTKRLIPGIY